MDDLDQLREQYVGSLRESLHNGTLSLEEYEAKLDAIYAARTLVDIELLAPLALSNRRQIRSRALRAGPVAAAAVAIVCLAVALPLALRASTRPTPAPGGSTQPTAASLRGPSTTPHTQFATGPTTTLMPLSPGQAGGPPPSPYPGNGYVAVVAASAGAHVITVDPNSYADPINARYATCPGFSASMANGRTIDIGELVGDYAKLSVNSSKACATSLVVGAPPLPPSCFPGNYGGQITVTYMGSNQLAHSILYKRSGSSIIQAIRWCTPPAIVGANQAAAPLSAMSAGMTVTLGMFGAGWVSSVTVGQQQ